LLGKLANGTFWTVAPMLMGKAGSKPVPRVPSFLTSVQPRERMEPQALAGDASPMVLIAEIVGAYTPRPFVKNPNDTSPVVKEVPVLVKKPPVVEFSTWAIVTTAFELAAKPKRVRRARIGVLFAILRVI